MGQLNIPFLLFADERGNIYSHPYLRMCVSSAKQVVIADNENLISMPQGSSLFYLPGRAPIGFNLKTNRYEALYEFRGKPVWAVAAFLIPAFVSLNFPAYEIYRKETLPLWAYTACGSYGAKYYVSARRIDKRVRQSPRFYDNEKIAKSAREHVERYPNNRLYKHLSNCALNYNCLAAKNLFLKRWEAPLPTARTCNAQCIGCLSLQKSKCDASHQRIKFFPTIDEMVTVMINHLKIASEAIVSFGQGCEGEPLMGAGRIAKAIEGTRKNVARGTINMNTNGSIPENIKLLCGAGMDSFRISLNSTQKKIYDKYFRPINYEFKDVLKSIDTAKKCNKFVSINLFVFPGVTDQEREVKSLLRFIKRYDIDMIQWRNLNIDPQFYKENIGYDKGPYLGISNVIDMMTKQFPKIKMGYFNLCL